MSLSNINPPVPSGISGSNENKTSLLGHRLIRLVRSAEKTKVTAELSVLLDELSESFLRRGLLGGDTERADKVLSSGIKTLSNSRQNKKGGNKSKNSSLNITNGDDKKHDAEGDSGVAADDINLLLSALVRLARGNQEMSTPVKTESNFPCHLTIGGFNVCIAALRHTISRQKHESCAQAEYELIIGIARGLLTGVCRTVKGILASSSMNDDGARNVVVSGFRAATLLLSLYGTKLSRNQPVLSLLRSLTWEVIVIQDEALRCCAGNLLAALPLGGIDKQVPAVLWTDGIIDGTAALFLLSEAVVPQKSKTLKALDTIKAQGYLSDVMKANVSGWIERIEKEESADERLLYFSSVTSALSQYVVSLLQAETLLAQESTVLSAARFPVVEMLDLLETMLSFPTFAESLYYGTKKRLRFEIIEDGLLNAHDIASSVANHVKGCGLGIFDAVLQGVGRSVLLPFGRRIVKMAHSLLLTSCTVPLRHALDPTSSVRLDGKRKKWLHTSLEMRTKSIDSFKAMICTMRSNALVAPSSGATGTRRGKSNQADKGVVLVVGCLLEQLAYDDVGNWGSADERACTAVAAMDAISSILTQGGGFLSLSSRALIESAIKTCQATFQKRTIDSLFSSSAFKVAFLSLTSTCLVTPWPDGATTSQTHDFLQVANQLASDMDGSVASTSRSLLQIIHSMKTPRSPPLVIVTRTSGSNNETFSQSNGQDNASAIVDRLKVAQESMHAKEVAAIEESASKTAKRKKEKKEEPTEGAKTKRARLDVSAISVDAKVVESKPKKAVLLSETSPALVTEDKTRDDVAIEANQTNDDAVGTSVTKVENEEDDDMADFFPGIVDTGGPDEED